MQKMHVITVSKRKPRQSSMGGLVVDEPLVLDVNVIGRPDRPVNRADRVHPASGGLLVWTL